MTNHDSNDLPPFAVREAAQNHRYPNRLDIGGSIRLIWRVSDWHRAMPEGGKTMFRELFGWIECDSQRIAAIWAFAFQIPSTVENDEFLDEMDSRSQQDLMLAEALCRNWVDVSEITEVASILELRALWIAPDHVKHGWAPTIEGLWRSAFGNYALLITRVPGQQDLLGVEALPGERGWMWRPNPDIEEMVPRPMA